MVDILLLMLMFWMMSVSVRLQSCVAAEAMTADVDSIALLNGCRGPTVEVAVDANDCVYVNAMEVTDFDSLLGTLKDEHAMISSDVLHRLLDPESTHGQKIQIANAAALAGFRRIECSIREFQ